MTYEEARNYIKMQKPDFLRPDGRGKGYVCPACGSGSGKHGTGMTMKQSKNGAWYAKCWACGESFDIFKLWGIENNVSEFKDQLDQLCQYYGITIERLKKTVKPQDIFPLTKEAARVLGFLPSVRVTIMKREVISKEKGKQYEDDKDFDLPDYKLSLDKLILRKTIGDPFIEVEYKYVNLRTAWMEDHEAYDYMFSERAKWAVSCIDYSVSRRIWIMHPEYSKEYYRNMLKILDPVMRRYKVRVADETAAELYGRNAA